MADATSPPPSTTGALPRRARKKLIDATSPPPSIAGASARRGRKEFPDAISPPPSTAGALTRRGCKKLPDATSPTPAPPSIPFGSVRHGRKKLADATSPSLAPPSTAVTSAQREHNRCDRYKETGYSHSSHINNYVCSRYNEIKCHDGALKCLYLNAQSIIAEGKFVELCVVIKYLNLHLIVITETWAKNEVEAKSLELPNYKHYYSYRTNSRGGGVSIFVHEDLVIKKWHKELYVNGSHFLWVYLDALDLSVGGIYRQEKSSKSESEETKSEKMRKFLNNLTEQYRDNTSNGKKALVFGDININLLDHSDRYVMEYKGILQTLGITIQNEISEKFATRVSKKSNTIVDHVVTNVEYNMCMTLIDSSLSDHKQIYLEVSVKKFLPLPHCEKLEKVFNNQVDAIKHILRNNPRISFLELERLFIEVIYNNVIPNQPRKGWINENLPTLINAIDERNGVMEQLKKTPGTDLKTQHDKKKEEVSNKITNEIMKYYFNEMLLYQNRPLKLWKLIYNNIDIPNNKPFNKNGCCAPKNLDDTVPTEDTKKICEHLYLFFSTIGAVNKKQQNFHVTSEHSSILYPTSQKEVLLAIIDYFENNTCSGEDDIYYAGIMSVKDVIAVDLANCINKCMEEGYFPNSLNIANIRPIFKSGDKSDLNYNRPISERTVMTKVFEEILCYRLISFLFKKQYGIRSESSPFSENLNLVTKIYSMLDKGKIVLDLFINFKEPFKSISHQILLKILSKIGVKDNAYSMFRSYLTNMRKFVRTNCHDSDLNSITCGVPQGSLGALLFLIYIDSIHEIANLKGDVTLHAEGINLFYSGSSADELTKQAQLDLDNLSNWFQSNRLTIDLSNTNYMFFYTKNKTIGEHGPIKYGSDTIEEVKEKVYQGLKLDPRLSWKPHIEKLLTELASLRDHLGLGYSIPRQELAMFTEVIVTIYNSLVKPFLDNFIEIWGCAAKEDLNELQKEQNKIMRKLFGSPTQNKYKDTKIMTLAQTSLYQTCLLVRKILTGHIQSQIVFKLNKDIHQHYTRHSNDIYLDNIRTNYGKNSIGYRGAQLYNDLPKDIKGAQSEHDFKRLLVDFCLRI